MKKKHSIILVSLMLLALMTIVLIALNNYGPKPASKRYKVLYIASYHPTFSWSTEIENGIINSFKDKNISIQLKSFYMDTKRRSAPQEIRLKGKEARDLIFKWDPDIIITSDENALTNVALPLRNTKYKFVFCGVNGTTDMYGLPAQNITGVLERWHYIDAIKILKLLDPKVRRINILSENSESSKLLIDQFIANKNKVSVDVNKIYLTNSFEEWKQMVQQSQKEADALMIVLYFSLKDPSGKPVPERDVIRWVSQNSKIPEFGLWPFLVNDGGLISVAVNGFSQGHLAGNIAAEILAGESPGNIPIQTTQDGAVYINAARAKQLRLAIPPDLLDGAKITWEKKCYE